MKAVMIHATGGPEVLRLEEAQRPEPDAGEVLIAVRSATVNPVDWKYRRGLVPVPRPFPAVLGEDVSGIVEISRVDGFVAGDEVLGVTTSGGYAQYATASGTAIALKPAGLAFGPAAALTVSGLTAWQGLFDVGRLKRGQTALIAGAAGGIGHLAVQLAKHAGATVIGTGSSRNRDFVLSLGADEYVDYTRSDVGQAVGGVDLALDTVGGATTASLIPSLRDGGTVVTVAYPPEASPADNRVMIAPLAMKPRSSELARIAGLAASGDIHVEIAEQFPLADVRRAHALSESGRTRGKIVLSV